MRLATAATLAAALACGAARAGEAIAPPASLVLDGVPPIAADLAAKIEPYTDFRAQRLLSWHPTRREMLVSRRLENTNQIHLVTEPGAKPEPLTDFRDPVNFARYEPAKGGYFVFLRAQGGNEVYRVFREDVATKVVTALSPEGERATEFEFARNGKIAVYATQLVDHANPQRKAVTSIHLLDPARPKTDRVAARLEGGGWAAFHFSEDNKRLVFLEYVSATESYLWVMDVATGRRARITPKPKSGTVFYGDARFTRDGRGVVTVSDGDGEFRRLVYLPISAGRPRVLTPRLNHDVEQFDISFDANRIAFVTNESGASVLRLMELASFKELPRPSMLQGVIRGLEWRRHSHEVAFSMSSAKSAGDVFSYDIDANQLTRWTNGNSPKVNTSAFAEPRLVKWKSFDGLEVSGFLYAPPSRFTGRRPVIVNIHGGPEAQARPDFIGRNNYFVDELGVAMIYPNVRGSEGFGKTWLALDDGRKREDSVKDIGALLDWIAAQPELDASRVMIIGGSYGGYMTLACAVHYADRIAGAVDVVGISSFVTFLEHTESYRRDLRRVEYGDERDPLMRDFLESISPLNHADKITKPLLVASGRNDPRVPYTEGEQIVANLKARGTTVWYIVANDEGHGYAKKPNADFLFYAMAAFARETLLK
ncbi:MAG TPA: prolyl oligopeptidase family serine peptidase [Usitatibacter sp.]|nr:prolyl oligopeptidase family serine peptidase [Usitatibacter sp.]